MVDRQSMIDRLREDVDNIIVNDTVFVTGGEIMNNPFSIRLENSEAAQWVIQNEEVVKRSIKNRFRVERIMWGNVDDCYDLLLNEFNTKTKLQFNKNYFGKNTGYGIAEFVLNRVKYIVLRYRKELKEVKTTPLLTQTESDYYFGEIEENFAGEDINNIDRYVESDLGYWDELYEGLLVVFDGFLLDRSYKEFDYERLLYYMYLDVGDVGNKVNIENQYKRVAEKIGESVELVETVVEDMITAVKEKEEDGTKILEIVQELLTGRGLGWSPEWVRKK